MKIEEHTVTTKIISGNSKDLEFKAYFIDGTFEKFTVTGDSPYLYLIIEDIDTLKELKDTIVSILTEINL